MLIQSKFCHDTAAGLQRCVCAAVTQEVGEDDQVAKHLLGQAGRVDNELHCMLLLALALLTGQVAALVRAETAACLRCANSTTWITYNINFTGLDFCLVQVCLKPDMRAMINSSAAFVDPQQMWQLADEQASMCCSQAGVYVKKP